MFHAIVIAPEASFCPIKIDHGTVEEQKPLTVLEMQRDY